MLYFVSAQDPVPIPRLNTDYHQQSLDDYLLFPRAHHHHAPAREHYFGGLGHSALYEDPIYGDLGSLGSTDYLSDPYGSDYLYEAQLIQARRAALARRRQLQLQLQRQREQEQIAIALRQAALRRQQAERQREVAIIQRARQRQAQLAQHEQAQQAEFATKLLTSLFTGDESSALPEAHRPKVPRQATKPSQGGCGNCQCNRATAAAPQETPKPQATPAAAAQPNSTPFVHPFLQLAVEMGLPALFEQGANPGADLQRQPRCAMRQPAEKQPTGDDTQPTDPARRQSLDNLGLIRAEFDLARMEMENGTSSSAHFEEKLIHILEKLDGVESDGDESVRTIRRSLARDLSFALDTAELAKTKKVDGDADKKVHFEDSVKDSTTTAVAHDQDVATPTTDLSAPQQQTAPHANASESHEVDTAAHADNASAHHPLAAPTEDFIPDSFPPQFNPVQETKPVDLHSVSTESSLDAAENEDLEAAVALSLSSSGEEDTNPTPTIKRRHTIDSTGHDHDHDTVLIHSDGESEGSVKGYEVL